MSAPNYSTRPFVIRQDKHGYTQPCITAYLDKPRTTPDYTLEGRTCSRKPFRELGIVQIIFGFVCIVANTVGIVGEQSSYAIGFISFGIGSGVFFLVSGALGIAAYVKPRQVHGLLVISLISVTSSLLLFFYSALSADLSDDCSKNCFKTFGRAILTAIASAVVFISASWASLITCFPPSNSNGARRRVQTTTEATMTNYADHHMWGAYPRQPAAELCTAPPCLQISREPVKTTTEATMTNYAAQQTCGASPLQPAAELHTAPPCA